jgi:hypothetical protein
MRGRYWVEIEKMHKQYGIYPFMFLTSAIPSIHPVKYQTPGIPFWEMPQLT